MAQGSGQALSPKHTARDRGHYFSVWVGASPLSICVVLPDAAWLLWERWGEPWDVLRTQQVSFQNLPP